MTKLSLIPVLFLFFSMSCLHSQTIILGQNAYLIFVCDTSTELYSEYKCEFKKNKVIVHKTQYIYHIRTKNLVVIKKKKDIPVWDFPENFVGYQLPATCDCKFVASTYYMRPTHEFKILRNKVYTHFGYALKE